MANISNFFVAKKPWSQYKDKMLSDYLTIYLQKILMTKRDTVYIDGFAGVGKFEDGKEGSPIIVSNLISMALSKTQSQQKITPFFIEYKHAAKLKENLCGYENVINGDYKLEVRKLLAKNIDKNVFLYVDPFGIKHLHYDIFHMLASNKNSVELLINFCSFGFIREGCRLLNAKIEKELDENAGEEEADSGINDIENMNKIANGDYWQEIIKLKKDEIINMDQAEKMFVRKYMQMLGQDFKYIFEYAVKTGDDFIPKYRMIFATNHIEGALIMSEVMIKCNNEMTLSNRNYQQSFFDYEYEKLNCEDDIIKVLHKESENKQEIDCKDLCMLLYAHCGPKYLHKDIREALLKLETNEIVIIDRQRKLTPTGKTSKALDFIKDKISIKFNFENTQESFL